MPERSPSPAVSAHAQTLAQTLAALCPPAASRGGDAGSPAPSAQPAPLPCGAVRYEPRAVLAEGGMGLVLEAVDAQFGRRVALKELKRGLDSPDASARFELEALVTANLEHPGVPVVYERGLRDGAPFYVMGLVQGQTLADAVLAAPTLAQRLRLLPHLLSVAQTLAYAHARGVVHRDIKPENVLIGRYGETVVLDWGISRVRGWDHRDAATLDPSTPPTAAALIDAPAITQPGAVFGTPAYMAPEQASGDVGRVDERTDVFALGVLLYYIVCGRPPYEGGSTVEVLLQAAQGAFRPAVEVAPEAPKPLLRMIEHAMALNPEGRFVSAEAFAERLSSLTADAVAHAPAARVRVWVGALSMLGLLLGGLSLIASVVVISGLDSLAGMGLLAILHLAVGGAGVALGVVEWRTRGRFQLSHWLLAFAGASLLGSIVNATTGLIAVFGGLARHAADASVWRERLGAGVIESLSGLALGAQLTAIQLLIWALARWRARGAGSA